MTNRKEKIEIETVHNHVHHAGIKKQFEFLQKISRTLLIRAIEYRRIKEGSGNGQFLYRVAHGSHKIGQEID